MYTSRGIVDSSFLYLVNKACWMSECSMQGDVGDGDLFTLVVSMSQEQRGWSQKMAGNLYFGKTTIQVT